MNERIAPFSRVDADHLRAQMPSFDATHKSTFHTAPDVLKRYLYHYGFDHLFDESRPLEYKLEFKDWAEHQIACHTWKLQSARATVLLAHGLFDHTGLYLKLAKRLLQEGYNVTSIDLPGHGLSSGKRVAIGSFDQYADVLAQCLEYCQQQFGNPCHMVGQSTGAAAVMNLLLRHEQRAKAIPRKTVLLAPLVRVRGWTRILLSYRFLRFFMTRVPRRFGVNSHDKNFLHFLAHQDPLQTTHIDVPWIRAMHSWAESLKKATPVDHSVLVIQGTGDTTVDWRWNMPLIAEKFPDASVRYIEGGLHHLVNEAEPWRGAIYDALCDFLQDKKKGARLS